MQLYSNSSISSIRRETALPKDVLALGSLEEFDSVIESRLVARSSYILAQLDNAGGRFSWPFSEEILQLLFPNRSDEERANALEEQVRLGQDAVRSFTLGDIFLQASERNPAYIEKAKMYWARGSESLKSALGAIENSVMGEESNTGIDGTGTSGLRLISIVLPLDKPKYRGGYR